jgi:muconate cycloisomerase
MRISKIDVWKVVVLNQPGVVSSPEYPDDVLDHWSEVPKHIVRLHSSDGHVGIGETNRGVSTAEVDACAKALHDQDPDRMPLWQLPCPRNGAYDAFEMAIFDLLGKAREVPAHVLLGGKCHDEVPVDFWVALCTPQFAAERVKVGVAAGYHGIKTKGKFGMPIVEMVHAIKEVAPHWTVTVDPNQRFHNPARTIELAEQLRGTPGLIFESPMPQNRLDWYARIRGTCGIPIALHLGTIRDLVPALELGCADIYNLNGSMTEFVISTRAAHAAGCPVWHGSGNDLAIRGASFVQALAATPAELWPSDIFGQELREDDLLEEPLPIQDGKIAVSDRPGLGVELDVAAVERHVVP